MAISSDSMTFYATGRRKTSVARVWITGGSGKITINRRNAGYRFRWFAVCPLREPVVPA